MENKVTFDRQSNGQFSPQVDTPQPRSGGEEAVYGGLALLLGAALWEGCKYIHRKVTEKDE